jgi:hypothetical protein
MPTEQEEQASRPHCGRLLKFFWMYGGIFVLLIIAAVIMADKLPWFTWVDIPYWAFVGAICAARALDVFFFRGQTGDGRPATVSHLLRFVLIIVLSSAALWGIAHVMAKIIK